MCCGPGDDRATRRLGRSRLLKNQGRGAGVGRVAGHVSVQDDECPVFAPGQLDQFLLGGQQDRVPLGKQSGGGVIGDLGRDDPRRLQTHRVDIPFHTSPFHSDWD